METEPGIALYRVCRDAVVSKHQRLTLTPPPPPPTHPPSNPCTKVPCPAASQLGLQADLELV